MKERWHPFLFAIYPVLFLFAQNNSSLPVELLGRPLLASLLLGSLALVVARLVLKDARQGALLAAAMILFWGTYGQFLLLLPTDGLVGKIFRHHRVLLPLGFILLGCFAWKLRRSQPSAAWVRNLNLVAKVVSLTLVVFSLGTIVSGIWADSRQISPEKVEILKPVMDPADDIYHIVLDGYPRADILKDLYGFDNEPFLAALRQRGFCTADSAHSNYAQTVLSVVSTMSGRYLKDGDPSTEDSWQDRRHLARRLRRIMQQRSEISYGAWTRAFATGYSATEILDADEYLSPAVSLNEFERALVAMTPLDAIINLVEMRYGDVLHRQRVEFTFENLPVPRESAPRAYTFAHIVAPHPPFVFAPVEITAGAVVPLADGDHIVGESGLSVLQYRAAYRAQISAVNERFLKAVDEILSNGRPSVILVHGDHGPGSLLKWENQHPDETSAKERFSILLALRMSDADKEACWPAMTPVNAVRVMQNRLYGTRRDTLADRSFFSTWSKPFEFVEIKFSP